ncbi:5-oxoprolinase subunit PxpA [Wielerella bovis]|uniref:5-oxoprolinase subunit PxpA n=1 Tax=Wielerella bovis TaxID=2917790 RepID=UPI00201A16F0|nr:5-oxoprolinase subunit PxpA [Wielerella bovis]ULJ64414.1 5-oxoprolinase subunit PxpA [Wielerella bovis]
MQVDLNADLAEACGVDEALLQRVTSANICCGVHAGGAEHIAQAFVWAKENGVRVGAHPSFPDRENFGRKNMDLPPNELRAWLLYQLGAVQTLCDHFDVEMAYVKPHGALYNQSAQDLDLANLIAQTIREFNPKLKLMGLSGSLHIQAAQNAGLGVISEVFADRRYLPDGSLVPRSRPDATVSSDDEAVAQVLQMVRDGSVTAVDGSRVAVQADSICLHGDGEHALEFADKIRKALADNGIKIQAA